MKESCCHLVPAQQLWICFSYREKWQFTTTNFRLTQSRASLWISVRCSGFCLPTVLKHHGRVKDWSQVKLECCSVSILPPSSNIFKLKQSKRIRGLKNILLCLFEVVLKIKSRLAVVAACLLFCVALSMDNKTQLDSHFICFFLMCTLRWRIEILQLYAEMSVERHWVLLLSF